MDYAARDNHLGQNPLHSLPLMLAIFVITIGLVWMVAGVIGILCTLLGGGLLLLANDGRASYRILRKTRARLLGATEAPALNGLVEHYAQLTQLPATPVLYSVPSAAVNAFAVGNRHCSAVAISEAMLCTLSSREISGVLAHEVSHIRINDLWMMGIADYCNRVTRIFATAGLIVQLLNLVLLPHSSSGMSWIAMPILVCAPMLCAQLQLALSRVREYEADLGAVELTGDPQGLATALEKMEQCQRRSRGWFLQPGWWVSRFSMLRTHPLTKKRIKRLLPCGRQTRRLPGSCRGAFRRPDI